MADKAGIGGIVNDWLQGVNNTDVTGNTAVEDGSSISASDSTVDDDIGGEEVDPSSESELGSDKSAAPATKGAKAPKVEPASGDKEKITITDEKGRRQIEIDYSNKEQIKKIHQMAYGARKWQAERDAAKAELEPVRKSLEEMKTNWDTLENAFSSKGMEGVVELIGGKGAYKTLLDKAIQRQDFLRRASPEELAALEARETAAARTNEAAQLRKEMEEFKAKIEAEKETSDTRSLESKIHPAFDKYRFADKLGDANDEHMFDQMLWRTAMDRLVPYEEQYGSANSIPPAIIEREFRAVASTLRNRIGVQAEKAASKAVERKKQEATENVQANVKAGYKASRSTSEQDKLMNQGAGGIAKLIAGLRRK